MSRELEVEIDEDGNVSVDALGFRGKACQDVLAEVEKLLGRVSRRRAKPEIHQREAARERRRTAR